MKRVARTARRTATSTTLVLPLRRPAGREARVLEVTQKLG